MSDGRCRGRPTCRNPADVTIMGIGLCDSCNGERCRLDDAPENERRPGWYRQVTAALNAKREAIQHARKKSAREAPGDA